MMAIWQFTVALFPRHSVASGASCAEEHALSTPLRSDVAWRRIDVADVQARFDALLPRGRSWHTDLMPWGTLDSDQIQVWVSRSSIDSAQVCFDLRQPNFELLQGVVAVCTEFGLAIALPDANILQKPDVESLLRAAAESDAAHYVIDAESFLANVDTANARAT